MMTQINQGRTARTRIGLRTGLAAMGLAAAMVGQAPADSDDKVRLVVAGSDGISSATPLFVAEVLGYFEEAGLEVEYLTMAGGAATMSAAIARGDVQIGLGAASQYMGSIANGLTKGKLIGEFTDNNYVILGGDGISDPSQLRGKRYGISSHNAGDHIYSMAVLEAYGIGPDDVEWVPLGSPPSRLSALVSGKVDGIEMTLTSLPEREAGRIIVSAEESPVPFVSAAIFASQDLIDGNKEALTRFLGAIGRGADWIRANPEEAVASCVKSGSSEGRCRDTIRVGTGPGNGYTWSSTARLNVSAISAMMPSLVAATPKAEGMSIDDYVDATVAPSEG